MDAAKARIESLNPLVKVETISDPTVLEPDNVRALLQNVDLVCVTDWARDELVSAHLVQNRAGSVKH